MNPTVLITGHSYGLGAALAAACLFVAVGSSLRLAGWDMPEDEEAS